MADENNTFDQAAYWVARHEKYKGDPRSVGNLAADAKANADGEHDLKRAVALAARLLGSQGSSVVDLGCGYGRVAADFIDSGYEYLGVDVSPVAISQAKDREPRGKFIVSDLSNWADTGKFHVCSVLYVFVHFVDDDKWRRFLHTAMSLVREGGWLYFADHFPEHRSRPVPHVTSRPLSDYEVEFEANGFKLDLGMQGVFRKLLGKSSHGGHMHFARKIRS
ncbi:class I SAM-dependent methyltransferase [Methylorubrum populi]|uniref:class I SAM-dependent methyltransferase n=1 Tax=Methylorubrum populi TaxID=223967 RepID=UPI001153C93E|nr:class I SAM-dependent methyltransferase [Methylorubrum populi]QDI82185.1 class I SAM-dependent methyltransferase [Methylorubrum populi]